MATALSAPWSPSTAGIPAVSAAAAYAEVVASAGLGNDGYGTIPG